MKLEKYNAALLYYSKSFPSLLQYIENPSQLISHNGLLKHIYILDIIYNTGLSLLFANKTINAFLCFELISNIHFNKPQVWLRMS